MKIIIVGASGTMGRHLTSVFKKDHEVVTAATKGCDISVDIASAESIDNMYKQAGAFDALVSTAGPSYVGPWKKMTEKEFRKGQHYINSKGSFSLITGALTHEPQLNFANASAANGAVEAFVRAAAIELENGIRINAVSPTVIENSPQYFPFFPGDIPVTMQQLEYGFRKSVFGANTGQVIKPY
jgi:NAD(P)-dependent dehydrogenase (short-subunit alcohol dehydrogenase family)